MKNPLSTIFGLFLTGCAPLPLFDTMPPQLVDTLVSPDGSELALDFDEPVTEAKAETDASAQAPTPTVEGARVKVSLPRGLKPGRDYRWTAEVRDTGGNLTSVSGRFYGPNDHPASLRLSEIRVAGSGKHTDFVELKVLTGGSLGGWTVDAFSGPESRQRTALPDIDASSGDFVVIHYKPTGDPAEKNESDSRETSGGSDTEPTAWDFWQTDGKGLSAVKGLVALRSRPDGPITDALLYSQHQGEAADIADAAGWPDRQELDPDGCTATRTWCRTEEPAPVWMLVANGHATPGKPNRLTPWVAPTSIRSRSSKTRARPKRRLAAGSAPSRPNVPESTSIREGEAKGPNPPRTNLVGRGGRNERHRSIPRHPRRPRPVDRGPGARDPLPPVRRGPEPKNPDERREEPPPTPAGPPPGPKSPGTGPTGCLRQEAAIPVG